MKWIPRKWLVEIRNQRNMTQQQIADAVPVDRSFYAQIETGQRGPSVDTAQKIAKVLGFDWTLFYAEKSGEKRQSTKAG